MYIIVLCFTIEICFAPIRIPYLIFAVLTSRLKLRCRNALARTPAMNALRATRDQLRRTFTMVFTIYKWQARVPPAQHL